MRRTSSVLVLVSVLASSLLTACSKGPVAVELRVDGQPALRCAKASVEELNPKPGGWTYQCEGGGSVYIIYDTGEGPGKGTVKMITVTTPDRSVSVDYKAGYLVEDRATSCPTAEGTDAGPPALKQTTGSFTFMMAEPCAKLELQVDPTP
jgi:hypothetical protein